MDVLKNNCESIRILASRELNKHGINLKLKNLPRKKISVKRTCYGVAIRNLDMVDMILGKNKITIPKIFYNLCTFIGSDMNVEGIFRIEGSKIKQKNTIKYIDKQCRIPDDISIIEAGAVLKAFIRNLPDALIHQDYERWFVEAAKLPEDHIVEALLLAVFLLPLEHIYLLMYFMQEITTHSSTNKMDLHNMAIVISPNIFEQTNKVSAETSSIRCDITKIMMQHAKEIGCVPEKIIQKLDDFDTLQAQKKCRFFW
ncbi:rho GTPase-activating protein 11A-like isoform X2 [Cylas formicarius]|uniref:rho GTPase-activating protein 11A-like isoform X2 n=1 Tax=Cylas formicarius TaxID=197179 RepID=UPI002958518F|nr:rho GTPase-activating protein 11A-like isoform X2 [Cylas formicarius]